ncbi:hypothetical protein NLJ89_g6266 [Agrocybe chaxingu]|uniref:Aminoglycoside phosphotransferase domain-containing protein n=1 Tax=Agrocybe chaxingu TaxID=84603 RepID=A0A9W8JWS8_9AGAR|nr:hypothetical protein NLJ89_g6266 [Agrocybe chaxingu]
MIRSPTDTMHSFFQLQAYLVTLATHQTLVARVARRFMPRLKTASEVATIAYLDKRTPVPVPTIYDYDANPYNRLGGEWVLMSKAPGIPLAEVWHGLAYADIVKLLKDLAARVVVPLFAHRFNAIGSLYFGPDPTKPAPSNTASTTAGNINASAPGMSRVNSSSSGVPTPRAPGLGDPFAVLGMTSMTAGSSAGMSSFAQAASALTPTPSSVCVPALAHPHPQDHEQEYHIGPIISWPFFGSHRGELAHPSEINRGPFPSLSSYLSACLEREHRSVIRENEGKAAPHRLHLDPDEVHSSFHHRLLAVPGDESDDSDEWGLEESDDEWEGPGDKMYRDYRRMQRGTFLVRELKEREDRVRTEMGRWIRLMEGLTGVVGGAGAGGERKEGAKEEFGLDCHDLSLENVFVDEQDHTKITCIIDWESTTTRPLWQCAHVPAFMQSSPFVAKLFREIVAQLPNDSSVSRFLSSLPSL